jgi:hypothetical protein
VLRSAFFLSHAWGDGSVLEGSSVTVVEGLQRLLERYTGELVWTDAKDMKVETQFHRKMDQALRGAQCTVVCLSRLYLSRPNCLWELCWAVEESEARDQALLVVSVDPEVSFDKVKAWRLDRDLTAEVRNSRNQPQRVSVDRRTLAFVHRYLLGVKIYEEWQQGEGSTGDARRAAAVEEMLSSLRTRRPRAPRPKPALEVRKDDSKGGDWWYIHEG